MEIDQIIKQLPPVADKPDSKILNSTTTEFPRDRELHTKVLDFALDGGWDWDVPDFDRRMGPGRVIESQGVLIRKASAIQMFEETLRLCSDMAYDYDEQARLNPNFNSKGRRSRGRWLTMLGASGNGKSHLSKKVSQFRREKLPMYNSAFRKWGDIEDRLRQRQFAYLDNFYQIELFVLDDLFSGKDSEFTISKVFDLLNNRIGRFTVISCNLSLAQIGAKDSRIASRIAREPGNVVVELDEQVTSYNARRKS